MQSINAYPFGISWIEIPWNQSINTTTRKSPTMQHSFNAGSTCVCLSRNGPIVPIQIRVLKVQYHSRLDHAQDCPQVCSKGPFWSSYFYSISVLFLDNRIFVSSTISKGFHRTPTGLFPWIRMILAILNCQSHVIFLTFNSHIDKWSSVIKLEMNDFSVNIFM